MKLNSKTLRRMILNEIKRLNEESSTSVKDEFAGFINNKEFTVIDMGGSMTSPGRKKFKEARQEAADKLKKEEKDLKFKSFAGADYLKDTKPGDEYLLAVVK